MLSASSLSLKLALSLALVQQAAALTAAEWRDKTIYQVITDRFARPDSVTSTCNVADRLYCGGTWAALADKLDYIQGMGFDAIWISPVVDNLAGTTATGEAYHGYWSLDISKTNDKFGTSDDLKALSAALHSRGMYLMVDVVVNHVASTDGSSFKPGAEHGAFDTAGDYHTYCTISDYTNQNQVEQCWLGDNNVILPDIDTEDDTVVSYYEAWIKQLVSDYSIDGIRIDTVKHVRKDFWPSFTAASGVYALGEVLDGSVDYIAPYTEVMDGIFSYAVYYQSLYAFANPGGSMATLAATYNDMAAASKDMSLLGTFLDNHDQPRYASTTKDLQANANAAAWSFVTDGIPIVYYGQEQGFTGGADPANREPMWESNYDTTAVGYEFVSNLTSFRKQAGAADSTFYTTPAEISTFTSTEIVISKGPMVAVLSNRGSSGSGSVNVPSNSSLPVATVVVDLFTCTSWQTDKNGASTITVTNGAPQFILPLTDIGNLCPNGVTKSLTTAGSTDPPSTSTKSTAPAATTTAVTGGGSGSGSSSSASPSASSNPQSGAFSRWSSSSAVAGLVALAMGALVL